MLAAPVAETSQQNREYGRHRNGVTETTPRSTNVWSEIAAAFVANRNPSAHDRDEWDDLPNLVPHYDLSGDALAGGDNVSPGRTPRALPPRSLGADGRPQQTVRPGTATVEQEHSSGSLI